MRHLRRTSRRGTAALVTAFLLLAPALPAHAGTPQGSLPLPPMTRGAFVGQLLAALHVPLLPAPLAVFRDVPRGSPDYRPIETAAADGLAQGVAPDLFAPDRPINALSAATMAIKTYSPVAAAWAAQEGYLQVAVQLGLLPGSFLKTPERPVDLLEGQRLIAQAASLEAAAGSGGWQWLAASGDGAPLAGAIMDVLAAAVSGQPLAAVAPHVDPRAWTAVSVGYRHAARGFASFAALAPGVDWRVVGGGVWAVKGLGQGRYSADAALILETVSPLTGVPCTASQSAWLGWPTSPYFRLDFGEVAVSGLGVAGLNNLKGEVALTAADPTLPGIVQSGVAAYPGWSVMALGVATTYPTITAPAPAAGAATGLGGSAQAM